MLKDPVMKVDRWFTTELTQHLFETKDKFSNKMKKILFTNFELLPTILFVKVDHFTLIWPPSI